MKKSLLRVLVCVVFVFGCGVVVSAQLGGYKPASATASDVVEAAEFAVAEASKHEPNTDIKLVSVARAEKQTVAGINYRLCLKLEVDGESQDVKVIVFLSLQKEYSLTSWDQEDCS